jgi:ubiquinone/menaquinone biosynthesis C-methylase UbiE
LDDAPGQNPAQQHITSFWSTIAPGYEDHRGNVVAPGTREYDAWVAAVGEALPDAPADVLDVGTGTGFLALIEASLGHTVTGIDLAEGMLDVARAKAKAVGSTMRLQVGDAVAPPFPDASFDVVSSRHVLWTLREPEVAFANWRRLLRPGGRVVAFDGLWFDQDDDGPDEAAEPNIFDRHYSKDTRAVLPIMRMTEPSPLTGMFLRAGFAAADVRELPDLKDADKDKPPFVLIARV